MEDTTSPARAPARPLPAAQLLSGGATIHTASPLDRSVSNNDASVGATTDAVAPTLAENGWMESAILVQRAATMTSQAAVRAESDARARALSARDTLEMEVTHALEQAICQRERRETVRVEADAIDLEVAVLRARGTRADEALAALKARLDALGDAARQHESGAEEAHVAVRRAVDAEGIALRALDVAHARVNAALSERAAEEGGVIARLRRRGEIVALAAEAATSERATAASTARRAKYEAQARAAASLLAAEEARLTAANDEAISLHRALARTAVGNDTLRRQLVGVAAAAAAEEAEASGSAAKPPDSTPEWGASKLLSLIASETDVRQVLAFDVDALETLRGAAEERVAAAHSAGAAAVHAAAADTHDTLTALRDAVEFGDAAADMLRATRDADRSSVEQLRRSIADLTVRTGAVISEVSLHCRAHTCTRSRAGVGRAGSHASR